MTEFNYIGIGAGPVGLATAIYAKLESALNGKPITVLLMDKRENYKRGHTVYLDPSVIENLALKVKTTTDPILKEKIAKYHTMMENLKKFTPIAEIEAKLSEFAVEQMDITISKGEYFEISKANPLSNLIEQYNPQIVVAAGGYRCAATEEVFGSAKERRAFEKPLSYLLKAKFNIPELPKKETFMKVGTSVKAGRFVSAAWYSKEKIDGVFRGQAFATATKAEVELIEGLPKDEKGNLLASYGHPITGDHLVGLDRESMDVSSPRLNETRKTVASELRELKATNININIIKLSAYRNKEYVCLYNGVPVLSVGDASGGVPFQRSLCGSFQAITHLSPLLSSVMSGRVFPADLNNYTKKVDNIWKQESNRAIWKSRGLSLLDTIVSVMHQFIKSLPYIVILSVGGYAAYRLGSSEALQEIKKWRAVDGKGAGLRRYFQPSVLLS
jgi:hypothetical protein